MNFADFISCKLIVGSKGLVRFKVDWFSDYFTGGLIILKYTSQVDNGQGPTIFLL